MDISVQKINIERRRLLQKGLIASGVLAAGPGLWSASVYGFTHQSALNTNLTSNIPSLANTLHEVTVENDPSTRMVIPRGFTVLEVARTGLPAFPGSDYLWHGQPDGGATFAIEDGGWVYVSNSELDKGHGGVGAIRFNNQGKIIDSYSIASGTSINCAGGPTPWGTWLSCEETGTGLVYECDPLGISPAVPRPEMGAFTHEAAAVDPVNRHIYLTEDIPDGNLYRFIPDHYPANSRADLASGILEVAIVKGNNPHETRSVTWIKIPHPVPQLIVNSDGSTPPPTRMQVQEAEKFIGGEGCWYYQGIVYFTTKGDNRVWALDTNRNEIDLIYDKQTQSAFNPGIDDVDNITVSAGGDVLIAEDGAEMRLVVIGNGVKPFELINVLGHRGSEIAGPAFSPDGNRLYFSSQRGPAGNRRDGRTYEMQGPFFI